MAKEEPAQKADQVSEHSVIELLTRQVSEMSSMIDTMKTSGQMATSFKASAVGQDIGADEAIAAQMPGWPLNAKFWFDQVALQANIGNSLLLRHIASLGEIELHKARTAGEISQRVSRTWSSEDKYRIAQIPAK